MYRAHCAFFGLHFHCSSLSFSKKSVVGNFPLSLMLRLAFICELQRRMTILQGSEFWIEFWSNRIESAFVCVDGPLVRSGSFTAFVEKIWDYLNILF